MTTTPPRKLSPRQQQASESIRISTHAVGIKFWYAHITFGRAVVDELLAMHDRVWFGHLLWPKHRYAERYNHLRVQVAPFHRLNMPGLFVRIRPPPANGPRGYKLHRARQQFVLTISLRTIGLRKYMPAMPLDFAYAPTQFGPQGGLVIWLPDDYFVPPTKRQRKIKPNEDLML